MLDDIMRHPLLPVLAVPALTALVAAGLIRWIGGSVRGRSFAAGAIGLGLLAAYLVVAGVPEFPPRADLHKLGVVAGLGLVLGLALDAGPAPRWTVFAVMVLWPAVIAMWLGADQLAGFSTVAMLTAAAIAAGGIIALERLRSRAESGIESPVLLLVASAGLGVVALRIGWNPVALLFFGAAAAMLGFLAWNWPVYRFPFANAALMSAGGLWVGGAAALSWHGLKGAALAALGVLLLVFYTSMPFRAGAYSLGSRAMAPLVLAATALIPALVAVLIVALVG